MGVVFFLRLLFWFGFSLYIKLAHYLSSSNRVLLGDLTPVTAVDTDLSCSRATVIVKCVYPVLLGKYHKPKGGQALSKA